MAAMTTIKELRKMQPEDLLKEITAQQTLVVKLRLGVKLGNEKNSAKYIAERKQLARMKTVYNEREEAVAEKKPVEEKEAPKKAAPKKPATKKTSSRKAA